MPTSYSPVDKEINYLVSHCHILDGKTCQALEGVLDEVVSLYILLNKDLHFESLLCEICRCC
jgi:hypothetical protein